MTEPPANARLETFCDGVFAIALTILVLDLHVPAAEFIHSPDDLWRALARLAPSVFAFLLSFGIILISWVNHHAMLKLVDKSSRPFIYANGFFLLTIVILPFATSLLADYIFTPAAAPAVVVYSVVNLLQGLGWVLLGHTIFGPVPLARSAEAAAVLAPNIQKGRYTVLVYSTCVVLAFWFPLLVTATLYVIYAVWLIFGIGSDQGE